MKFARAVSLLLVAAAAPAFAAAPAWDSSGNSELSGTYYFRQVLFAAGSGGGISTAVAFFGNMTFSGSTTGTYTISLATLNISGSGIESYSATGTYSVSA